MIVYSLACERGHFFEGWFASAEACDRQAASGQLECPTCASAAIRKLPAAPYVRGAAASGDKPREEVDPALRAAVLKALRQAIVENTEDVGRRFAEVARRIHYQEEPGRGIRGQATVAEALELQEEGIPALAISPEVLPSEEIH